MEQQSQRLRPQGSRGRDRGGPTLDRKTNGRRSRTTTSLKVRSPEAAYKAGVLLLTVRDRTCAELARLLAVKGFAMPDSQAALEQLKAEGYLDDRRFASAWARGRLRTKPMGPHRLGKELQVKGVETPLVREVLENIYEEGEEPVARRAITGKLLTREHLPASSRTLSVARFLHRRGFSVEVIWRLLHERQQW